MNKTRKKISPVVLLILGLIICLVLIFRYGVELGIWNGKSLDGYRDKAYNSGSFTLSELPAGAQDFRWQCYNYGMAAYSYAGFTLTGQEYDDYTLYASNTDNSTKEDKENFVGKKVSDTIAYYDDYGNYTGFPKKNCKYVIDDNIEDYTILYYVSYNGAGSHVNAVVVKPDTGRFVVICGGSN